MINVIMEHLEAHTTLYRACHVLPTQIQSVFSFDSPLQNFFPSTKIPCVHPISRFLLKEFNHNYCMFI